MTQPNYGQVVITGANRGIGLELVRQFAPRADRIVACCRNPEAADDLQALATREGNIVLQQLDVTNETQIEALRDRLDNEPVDLLINNAGVYGPRGAATDKDAWHAVLEVNAMAPLAVSRALLDSVAAGHHKIVASVTSKMGSIADNRSGGSYIYRTSKTALNQTMRSFSHDVADRGITVLLLHPGWVKTAMGGPNALIDVQTSVSGMKAIIDRAEPAMSGRFYDYDGSEIPW
ncbi:MAG: SDR family oxidoreductase [Xanthomonadales bacterium]|nr:SDR family oxidoreductase [Xanthomonadales bacterium]